VLLKNGRFAEGGAEGFTVLRGPAGNCFFFFFFCLTCLMQEKPKLSAAAVFGKVIVTFRLVVSNRHAVGLRRLR